MKNRFMKKSPKKILGCLVAFAMVFFASSASAQCDMTLDLVDSWGDGWNGGSIDVTVDGATANYTADGFGATYDIAVSSADAEVTLLYIAGLYANENSFTLSNCDGEVIASMASGDDGFDATVGGAPASCDFTAVAYTAGLYAGENSFTITDCDGNVLASMASGSDGFDDCVDLGDNFVVSLVDSWGDGWNGGNLNVGGVDYTIDAGGSDFSTIVGACGTPGCTDDAACNFDADATFDDCSCTFAPKASTVTETVCQVLQ